MFERRKSQVQKEKHIVEMNQLQTGRKELKATLERRVLFHELFRNRSTGTKSVTAKL